MKLTNAQVSEVIEFPINTGRYVSQGIRDDGTPSNWHGVTWRYVYRVAEELRGFYRTKCGRKNYRVKVQKRTDEDGDIIGRIYCFIEKGQKL